MTHVTTFRVAGHHSRAIDTLAELGFVFEAPLATTTTLLDTFDGRVHRAGLQLRLIESDRVQLELSGHDTTPAHVAVDTAPRVPADLPPGPFRSRIAAIVELRALSPQLRVSAHVSRGELRDAADKIVAVVELHDTINVLDPPGVPLAESTIEIREIPGYAKQARRAVEALRYVSLVEYENDTLTVCASAAGVDLDGFAGSATVPLDADMPATCGFRLVFANLATTISANWQGTIDETDSEFLHDLRIAMRRTRTLLAVSKNVLPDAVLGHTRSEFAWLAGLTGAPRDLDVYLIEWSHYVDPLGADAARHLEPVRNLLERHCAEAHGELASALRSDRAAEVMNAWWRWLTEPLAEPLGNEEVPTQAGRPLGRVVAKRIGAAHNTLLERGRLIGAETPAEQVHDLRKDAKKLRYLLECFGSLLPEGDRKQYVKHLKALQDNLGEHQDAAVHVEMLQGLAFELSDADVSPETMVAIGRLTERLDQQRLAARAEFAERFAYYDTPATQRALQAMLEGLSG